VVFCEVGLARSARAEIYATSEAFCDQLVARARKTDEDYRDMTLACATAVQRHKLQAQRLTGAQRQQELILQATYLYFAAEGEARTHHVDIAVGALEQSRLLYQRIFDHAATPALRHKAQMGLNVVAAALAPARPAMRPKRTH
jgi:hypothetical protein